MNKETNDDDVFIDLCFILGAWIQNFFCFTIPVVGAVMDSWKGFAAGTAVSLGVFFAIGAILEGLIPVVEDENTEQNIEDK